MAIDTDKLKRETDIVKVVGHYTNLTKRGHNFRGLCIFHDDKNPSMEVNPIKQTFKCYSCNVGGDVIDFIQNAEGLEFIPAAEFLGAENIKDEWKPNLSIPTNVPPLVKQDRITSKPPLGSRPKQLTIRINDGEKWEKYDPVKTWDYKDENGDLIGIAARYEVNGKKEPRMWTFAKRGDDASEWGCGAFNYPRPLFNLDKITNSELPVLIVEGEKCAEAAGHLIPQYVSTTWSMGAHGMDRTSFEPLRGRKVVLMPDNDDAGRECMLKLADILSSPQGLNCEVKILDTSEMTEKWDIADALALGWTSQQFIAWAKKRVNPYVNKIADKTPEPTELKTEPITKPKLAIVNTPARTVAQGNTIVNIPATSQEVEIQAVNMSPDFFMQKFIDFHGADWRHIHAWNKWLQWDGDTWVTDTDYTYFDEIRQLIRASMYWDEARGLTEAQKAKFTFRAFIGGVGELISAHQQVRSKPDKWDANNMLLGIPGGVIDLKTGKSIDGAREQLISRKTAIKPEQGDCPLWISTINRATNNDSEMLDYLQRMAGYILTGETKEECFFFVYGPGASGKSTFCRTLTEILNEYSQAASMDAFMAKQNQEHATEIARMAGARLVVATETDEGARWNESRIKALTGRDKISARFMRGDLFDFQPTAKILIAGNHKPQLRSVGEEMKRRIHLIDFPTSIPEAERDRDLNEKLRLEYPQILNWMIEGAIKWNQQGLKRPESIMQATNEYLADEDGYSTWMQENCVIGSGEKCAIHIAYQSFQSWCDSTGEYCPSQKRFAQRLVEKGYSRVKSGVQSFDGFSMKENNDNYKYSYYDK